MWQGRGWGIRNQSWPMCKEGCTLHRSVQPSEVLMKGTHLPNGMNTPTDVVHVNTSHHMPQICGNGPASAH